MDRVAVFVDAGYLFAQGGRILAGRQLTRSEMLLDHEKVINFLESFATKLTGLPLLRVYWYDGTSTGPSPQHITLAFLPRIKVRLGFVNSVGQQKGVDSLVVTDMISLARNRSMADAVLISGDEDLRVGVQQAQEYGVRVHLVGLKPSRGTQSVFLLQEADTTHEWDETNLCEFLAIRETECVSTVSRTRPSAGTKGSAESAEQTEKPQVDPLLQVAMQIADEVLATELEGLVASVKSTRQIPMGIDGRLLARGRAALGHDLDAAQKKHVRQEFNRTCEKRLDALKK